MAQQQMQAQPPPGAVPPGMRPGTMPPPPPTQLPPQTAALLDSLPFNPVAYAYKDAPPRPAGAPPALPIITCKEHGEVVCPRCGVNFNDINQLGLVMSLISPGMVPPPPNVQFPNTAESIKGVRDKGNEQFKTGNYSHAAQLYTQSMVMSLNRPPWEQISFVKDEISSAMLNRSVAASKMGAWTAAYADAETCIKLNPRNPKAHFRYAASLAIGSGMGRLDEALAALETGLVFEPENAELKNTMRAIQEQLKAEKAAQDPSTAQETIDEPSTDAVSST
ncbi:hypothetical protein QFC22_003545 [Naganishia vaughanmartiniae]|uniref:Uncharacterized protein n=1 Tax=Naganishia vaughanmartiniae TaxID=1424756 RepID=A0ACC2X6R9_9TREE|nr:hypothetical protein QFC22_003545 [Naganishia vaughanmartiniae]